MPYLSLHSEVFHVSVVLGVSSQLSKLWRNDRVSTGKQKKFRRNYGVFLYMPKMRLTNCRRRTLHHELTESLELKFLYENIAFVLNNNYKCLLVLIFKCPIYLQFFRDGMIKDLNMNPLWVERLFPELDDLINLHMAFLHQLKDLQKKRENQYVEEIGPTLVSQVVISYRKTCVKTGTLKKTENWFSRPIIP